MQFSKFALAAVFGASIALMGAASATANTPAANASTLDWHAMGDASSDQGLQLAAWDPGCRDQYYAYQHPGNCGRRVPNPCGDQYYAYQHPGNCGRRVPNPCGEYSYRRSHPANCGYRHRH